MVRTALTADDSLAAIRARSKFGIAIAAMIRMIATTISNSINEKPFCFRIYLSLSPFEMWSFADLTRDLYSAIQPPTLPPIARPEPKTYTFFILRILTLPSILVLWGQIGERRGQSDRIRQNCLQYVTFSSVCFKMRKREQPYLRCSRLKRLN